MKHLKTYENIFNIFRKDKNKIKWNKNGCSFVLSKKPKPPRKFETIYPNYSDKQYWSHTYYSGKNNDIPFTVILKLNHEEDLQTHGKGGEYHFDGIVATNDNNWNIGDKYIDLTFTRGSMFEYEENGRLKLATPEQIELYDRYAEINKYNL